MDLHSEIMNIPTIVGTYNDEFCYKLGHRDARHAAAELALKADARIEELEEMLRWYVEEDEINEGDPENEYWVEGKHKAIKLLGMEIEELVGEKFKL